MVSIVMVMIVLGVMDSQALTPDTTNDVESDPAIVVTDWEMKGRILYAKELELSTEHFDEGLKRKMTQEPRTEIWVWDWDLQNDMSDYKKSMFGPEDTMMLVSTTDAEQLRPDHSQTLHAVVRRSQLDAGDLTTFDKRLRLDRFKDKLSTNNFSRSFLPFPGQLTARENVQVWRQSDSVDSGKNELNRLPNMINGHEIDHSFQHVRPYYNLNNVKEGRFDFSGHPDKLNRRRLSTYDQRYAHYKPLKRLKDNLTKYFATAVRPGVTADYTYGR